MRMGTIRTVTEMWLDIMPPTAAAITQLLVDEFPSYQLRIELQQHHGYNLLLVADAKFVVIGIKCSKLFLTCCANSRSLLFDYNLEEPNSVEEIIKTIRGHFDGSLQGYKLPSIDYYR